MKTGLPQFLGGVIVLMSAQASAETLSEYVTACKSELGFTEIPAMNCNDGVRFGFNPTGGLVNDVLGYKRINNYVDLTFACRWLLPREGQEHGAQPPFHATTAASLEMLIHNRQSGRTCFFAAKSSDPGLANGVSVSIVSPTSPGADAYWLQPSELNKAPTPQSPDSTLRCVSCHAAGPYIASPRITPFLAQFGLLNNGHDTVSGTRRYQAVNSTATGSVFNAINNLPSWNATIDATLNRNACASGCHSIGENISVPGITGFSGQELIPALYNDIAAVVNAGLMPTGSRKLSEDYRWMNVDLPDDTNTTGDVEVFYDLKANWLGFTPTLNAALTCETEPAYMEAHVVGSNVVVRSDEATAATTGFPDVLEKFDQTGLICRNASQSDGMCSNYVVRYVCLKDKLSVYSRWTGRALTIANADANGTRFAKGQPYNASWGPLSQTWHIEGLNDGTTNYKYVRFQNPWAGIYLNADDSLLVTNALKRDEWLSQQWVMENINGTKFVRFRNLWKTNMYLTMAEDSDFSPVNLQPLHTDANGQPDWLSQQWELK